MEPTGMGTTGSGSWRGNAVTPQNTELGIGQEAARGDRLRVSFGLTLKCAKEVAEQGWARARTRTGREGGPGVRLPGPGRG